MKKAREISFSHNYFLFDLICISLFLRRNGGQGSPIIENDMPLRKSGGQGSILTVKDMLLRRKELTQEEWRLRVVTERERHVLEEEGTK